MPCRGCRSIGQIIVVTKVNMGGLVGDKGTWIFGYGSLLWNPGFHIADRRLARLNGYRRAFCMRSIHHRGTPQNPGLVLALDEDADAWCDGVALQLVQESAYSDLETLRERELVSSAYLEQIVELEMTGGECLSALAYVIDRNHVQYCGRLPLDEQARIIAIARGGRGTNREYLESTVARLRQLGISDPELENLDVLVGNLKVD